MARGAGGALTMLLLDAASLDIRRRMAAGPLRPLADSLAGDLAPLLDRGPDVPDGKALLSRIGGRCETDGTELEFDPFSPHDHRCPACGRMHTGEWHDGWWLYPYHLWLAERAVHAAVLYALRGEPAHASLARGIVRGYAARYLDYPNRDNVLGPSRLFFSTYLESLWLLHICVAADLLGATGDAESVATVRRDVARPAVELIETYHEGASNRQVWNASAIVAARALLGEDAGSSGIAAALADVEALLAQAVGDDGAWYEGDNYHQFAHRGLWYAVMLGAQAGYAFQDESLARFTAGFAVPFRTALPDFTYPSRKDSRYAVSLRQWRFAEWCELGLARVDDPTLRWALARLYADDLDAGDTGRARSSGEAERPWPPVRLSRADLGWKSLLFAHEQSPTTEGRPPASLTVASQGYTVHRREGGDVYVALDWGASGGGHGHPDRLNLTFAHGAARWLDDLGTGSYVDPSLHWYRSTLAHNAPLVNGASQARVDGACVADKSANGFDMIAARADIAPGVSVTRTVVTGDGYFVDETRWHADHEVRFELPVHFAAMPALPFAPARLAGAGGTEDGFAFATQASEASVAAGTTLELRHEDRGHAASAWVRASRPVEWFTADGPGQPAHAIRRFNVIRMQGTEGVIRTVWAWRQGVGVGLDDHEATVTVGDRTDLHICGEDGWSIRTGGHTVRFDRPAHLALAEGTRRGDDAVVPADDAEAGLPAWNDIRRQPRIDAWYSDTAHDVRDAWFARALGQDHYRPTELAWAAAGRPRARVAVGCDDAGVVIDVQVEAEAAVFAPADAVNPYDNEHPDVNGHGVQVYFATTSNAGAWMVVPERGSPRARVRRIPGWGTHADAQAEWREVSGGFEVRVRIPAAPRESGHFALDVIVNDAEAGRQRRRGQLVMSGAHGEFAYLQGDRHHAGALLSFSAI